MPDCDDTVGKIELESFGGHCGAAVPKARQYYASHAAQDRWSVRELAKQIDRKADERSEIAGTQVFDNHASRAGIAPTQIFKDPYFLGFSELPPKAKLERHLHQTLLEARERLASRGVLLGTKAS